jgi:uncharacterized protein YhfF
MSTLSEPGAAGLPPSAPTDPRQLAFWRAFCEAVGGLDEARFYEAFYFADTEAVADELARLVLAGRKHATAASLWSFQAQGKRLPAPGDLSLVTDWAGAPQAVIETVTIELLPFDRVTAEFAAAEGEGDGSLAHWRALHRDYFSRELARGGASFSDELMIVCERFRLVYPTPGLGTEA